MAIDPTPNEVNCRVSGIFRRLFLTLVQPSNVSYRLIHAYKELEYYVLIRIGHPDEEAVKVVQANMFCESAVNQHIFIYVKTPFFCMSRTWSITRVTAAFEFHAKRTTVCQKIGFLPNGFVICISYNTRLFGISLR